MKIKVHKTCIRTLRQGDPGFAIVDGVVMAPRAGFEISERCPQQYRLILGQAIDYGWIRPIANVKDHELMWERLSND